MTIGFRIHPMPTRVDPSLVDRFRAIPVANISDSMSRMFAGGARLRSSNTELSPAYVRCH